ncbi:MAG: hybrid sensor histidine kinase/response regulator transcription factor [Rhodothermales bacterium]
MRPIRKRVGQPGFTLTVAGHTLTSYSTILWNEEERPTIPVFSSDNANAKTIGLRTPVSASDLLEAGEVEIRVYTPSPGGGMSPIYYLFTADRFFYQTPWFYLLCGFALVLAGVGAYRLRLRHVRRRLQEEAARQREADLIRLVDERTRDLQAEQQRTAAQAARLREADERKSRFVAHVSHEFRTPLTMILGPVQDLLDGGIGEEDAQAKLETVHRNARRLARLANQLLDLAKLEAGAARLSRSPGELVRFTEEVVQAFAPLAERHGVALLFKPETEHLACLFDADKLATAFGNLLANALKFTPEGGTVRVTVGDGEGGAEIRVRDTGIGIPKEKLPRIFDRFYQVADADRREHEGAGLGLALAKELVELHGGTIEATSEGEPGFGTEFRVTLPKLPWKDDDELREQRRTGTSGDELPAPWDPHGLHLEADAVPDVHAPPEPEAPTACPALDVGSEAPTVLLVEDNVDVRAYLRVHLAPTYRLLEATDGADALEKAHTHQPDLIVSDVMMPAMDGTELCRRLKASDILREIPMILLTAKADEASRIDGLRLGADDYIEKPFSMDVLKARIEGLLATRRALRAQYSREVVVQPSAVTAPSADEAFLENVQAVAEQHLGWSGFTADIFAREVGLSKSQLGRKLRALTGMSPAAFVREFRLQRAAQMLARKVGTVAEVAYAVGFNDVDHFGKLFKQRFGVTPSQYKADGA